MIKNKILFTTFCTILTVSLLLIGFNFVKANEQESILDRIFYEYLQLKNKEIGNQELGADLRVLTIPQGGTGTSTNPSLGEVLVGNNSGSYDLVATSTFGGSGAMAIGSVVTGGTSGSILFVDSSGDLAQNNANFFWDNVNNRLSIGTTTPSAQLAVFQDTSGKPAIAIDTVSGYSGNLMQLGVASTTVFSVNEVGALSFGVVASGTWQGNTLTVDYGGMGLTSVTDGYVLIGNSATQLEATSSIFVAADGKVGIGTITPSEELEVVGHIKADNFRTDETTNHTVFVGDDAGGSATYSTFVGEHAGQSNTGDSSNAVGYLALQSNTGAYSNAVGGYALRSNTGASSNAMGYAALYYNTGAYSNAMGYMALYSNTGAYSNAMGYAALYYNTGAYSNAMGYNALRSNTGAYSNAMGFNALYSNTGDSSNAVGGYALQYNNGNYNTAVGDNAFNTWTNDSGSAKTFDYTDIAVGTDYITITSHGFGAISTYINLKYTQGTSAITGMTNGGVYKFKIIDVNTLELYLTDITDAGTGTGHTLTPPVTYTNSGAFGYNAEPDASNQIVLGNTAVTQIKTTGSIYSSGAGDNYFAGDVGIGTTTPNTNSILTVEGSISLKEKTTSVVDTAGYGQIWVYKTIPNQLWFTNDAGDDLQVANLTDLQTFTNKRITPRVDSVVSDATPTIYTDKTDAFSITAQAVDITSFTTNLSGTPTNFQRLTIRIIDDGIARSIAWGASFEDAGAVLPVTTIINKLLTVEFIYNTVTSKWGCVEVYNET